MKYTRIDIYIYTYNQMSTGCIVIQYSLFEFTGGCKLKKIQYDNTFTMNR